MIEGRGAGKEGESAWVPAARATAVRVLELAGYSAQVHWRRGGTVIKYTGRGELQRMRALEEGGIASTNTGRRYRVPAAKISQRTVVHESRCNLSAAGYAHCKCTL